MKLDTTSYYPESPLGDEPDADPDCNPTPESGETETPESSCTAPIDKSEPAICKEGPELPPGAFERMVNSICTFLSWVLVPLLMPVYGVLLAFGLSILHYTPGGTRVAFTAVVAGINVLAPALVVGLLKKAGLVRDIGLNNREERFIPYMVCILCLAGTAFFMHVKGAPEWLVLFYWGGVATGICEVIVNRWWKISVHAAGIAGLVALVLRLQTGEFCMPYTSTWLMITIACAGLLGSARIWLGRHTLWQVLAGYAVGFCGIYYIMAI